MAYSQQTQSVIPQRNLSYAGIGARKTPTIALQSMQAIGEQLGESGWHLYSGYADGADMAFGRGAEAAKAPFTMVLPWEGFNRAPENDARFTVPVWTSELLTIAERAYNEQAAVRNGQKTEWRELKDSTKCLMARNVCQVLGMDLQSPVTCVICWTQGANSGGGTGQAIRVAQMHNIPVFDLASPVQRASLIPFIDQIETEQYLDTAVAQARVESMGMANN